MHRRPARREEAWDRTEHVPTSYTTTICNTASSLQPSLSPRTEKEKKVKRTKGLSGEGESCWCCQQMSTSTSFRMEILCLCSLQIFKTATPESHGKTEKGEEQEEERDTHVQCVPGASKICQSCVSAFLPDSCLTPASTISEPCEDQRQGP